MNTLAELCVEGFDSALQRGAKKIWKYSCCFFISWAFVIVFRNTALPKVLCSPYIQYSLSALHQWHYGQENKKNKTCTDSSISFSTVVISFLTVYCWQPAFWIIENDNITIFTTGINIIYWLVVIFLCWSCTSWTSYYAKNTLRELSCMWISIVKNHRW